MKKFFGIEEKQYVFELSNFAKRKKQIESITYNSINPIINNCLSYALKNLDKYKQQAIEILKFGIDYNQKKATNIDFSSCLNFYKFYTLLKFDNFIILCYNRNIGKLKGRNFTKRYGKSLRRITCYRLTYECWCG